MISQTAEYALRAVVALADGPNGPSAPQTTQRIAKATRVPAQYLSKVLQSLNRAGILKSQRGQGGGSTLAREPREITVYEVVQSVDPIGRITSCPLGLASHGKRLCPLHRRVDDAIGAVETAFRATTIQDLLDEPTTSRPLCELEVVMN
ncbi:MAG TPA: Rrf2 family transcriptional regulator [Armatimonadota bacterium]|jgi:Rrf2 family protein